MCVWDREKEWDQERENEGEKEKSAQQLFSIIIIILIHYPPNYWLSRSKRGDNTLDSIVHIQDSLFVEVVLMVKCMLLIIWKRLVISETEPFGQIPSTQCESCKFSLLDVWLWYLPVINVCTIKLLGLMLVWILTEKWIRPFLTGKICTVN